MAEAIRFHLDEHVNPAVAEALRSRGIDVTTAADAVLLGAIDDKHIEFAHASSRVVVTHDADFLRMHAAGREHSGIVYCHQESRTVREIIDFLSTLHGYLSADEMRNAVEFM